MSEAFDRGRDTEREVAAVLRRKLGAHVERDRRSGAGINKSDISDYYNEVPLFIECKDQETLKVKEWMRQTIEGASFNQAPTLVFRMDTELLACMRFADLINFITEIVDLRAEIADLRQPNINFVPPRPEKVLENTKIGVQRAVKKQVVRGAKTCKNGHICDDWGYCLSITCQFSRGYRKPKAKKGEQ